VTRRSLDVVASPRRLTEALGWVNAAFDSDPYDVRSWPRLDPLAPHARSVTHAADQLGIAYPTARLMSQLGSLLKTKSLDAQAEPLYRRALAINEVSIGTDHPEVDANLNNLALLLQDTNRLVEAEPLMRRALAIDEKSFGPEHPDTARALNNLAQLLRATGRLAEAEPLVRRGVAILVDFERKTGHSHPRRDGVFRNYTTLLRAMGKSEAEIEDAISSLTTERLA